MKILRVGIQADPPIEKLVPCDEFVVEDNDTVIAYYGPDRDLFGYFPNVVYAYMDDGEYVLEEDDDEDDEDDDDEDDDPGSGGGGGGSDDDPAPADPTTGGGGFVPEQESPVLLSTANGATPVAVPSLGQYS